MFLSLMLAAEENTELTNIIQTEIVENNPVKN